MGKASIKEVARIAEVSIATVSRVLNDPEKVKTVTRDKVLEAIDKTGYSPNTLAQSFRRGRTKMIMVVLPAIGDPFLADVVDSIRRTAGELGYSILINEARLDDMSGGEISAMLETRQVDGIILLASVSPKGASKLAARTGSSLPIVLGCEAMSEDGSGLPSVNIDNRRAAADATEFLIDLDHRRIAFVCGDKDSLMTLDREEGYRAAMEAAQIDIPDDYIVSGHMTIEGGQQAARLLLGHLVPPTAIFCANDEMAIGVIHGLRQARKRVPADISVVGFDDTRYASVMNPALTTVTQPASAIGAEAASRLILEIEGNAEGLSRVSLLPHTLIKRDSTARLRD